MNIQDIDIANLYISDTNVRKIIDSNESIFQLSKNITKNGLLNPLTVKLNKIKNKYEILAGQRRFCALKLLSYKTIQCNVLNEALTEKEQISISLTENIHKTQMTLSDKVKAYKKLHILFDENPKLVAEAVNVHEDTIKKYLKITHLPDIILDKLDAKNSEKISLDFACSLANLKIYDEYKLLEIIKIFDDVDTGSKTGLMRRMSNQSNYDSYEFVKYIENLKKIKVSYTIESALTRKIKKQAEEQIKEIRNNANIEKQKVIDEEHTKIIENQKKQEEIIIKQSVIQLIKSDEYYKKKILDLEKKQPLYITADMRNPVLQNTFREGLINRFNNCIISDMHFDVCEACHIIPFSEYTSFDMNNGLLLNSVLHKLFDNYEFSINPSSLCVEISTTSNSYGYLKSFNNIYIKSLEQYTETINLLKNHYNIFKKKQIIKDEQVFNILEKKEL
jgi:ParB/RepB/Spo0J family partition protein